MQQGYELGKFIRNRYDQFLGSLVIPELMQVRSTGMNRSRKTALMILAGLWPVNCVQKWHPTLNWQPIPVDYCHLEDEDVSFFDLLEL